MSTSTLFIKIVVFVIGNH